MRPGHIPPLTLEVLNEAGIPTDGLYSKGLHDVRLDDIDYLVNLTGLDIDRLIPPSFSGTLLSYRVRDPFGRDIQSYRETREELDWLVKREELPELSPTKKKGSGEIRSGPAWNQPFAGKVTLRSAIGTFGPVFSSVFPVEHREHPRMRIALVIAAVIFFSHILLHAAGERSFDFDTIIRNGSTYDGSGDAPVKADVGIKADRIAAVGDLSGASAGTVIEAKGLRGCARLYQHAFLVNGLPEIDGRSQSELRQGVTTEIFGEGQSMGPLTEDMKRRTVSAQGDLKFDIAWTTLSEYLSYLEKRGISPNVGSFVGAGTVRENVIGLQNKKATLAQIGRMCDLVRIEMEAGALGVGSSLGYAPDMFATTDELIAMCRIAAKYGGMYFSHVRNEGGRLIEAVEELLRISREAGIPAEICHLKAGGENNWDKIDRVISMIEKARRDGSRITADVYLYTASSNRLSSRLPAWAREGGRPGPAEQASRPRPAPEDRRRDAPARPHAENDFDRLHFRKPAPAHRQNP